MTTESDKISITAKGGRRTGQTGGGGKGGENRLRGGTTEAQEDKGGIHGSKPKITQKSTTISKFLALNSKLLDRQSTKTNSPMKSERLDVVLSETGEATGLVGYAAFAGDESSHGRGRGMERRI